MAFTKSAIESFTRPADTTAYASADLVANSTTAASVAPIEFDNVTRFANSTVRLKDVIIKKSNAVITNAAFSVHFFSATPGVPTNGDNGAFAPPKANWLAKVDVTVDRVGSNGSFGVAQCDLILRSGSSSKSIFALVEARGAYTPTSAEVFEVQIGYERD